MLRIRPAYRFLLLASATAALPVAQAQSPIGAPGPHLNVYGEFYNPVNAHARDITMAALTMEYEFRLAKIALRPLSFGVITSAYRPDGTSFPDADSRASALDVSSQGVSAGFIARVYMLESERFAWFTEFSGALAYWSHPFPPNGTPWNGMQRFGIGAKAQLSDSWALAASAREFHNSNGGGIQSRNPAYDGLGGYVGVTRALSGRAHDRAVAIARAGSSDNSIGTTFEYFASRQPENDQVDLYAISGEYEYHVPRLSWLRAVGSMSLYAADGSRPDPNRGLGEFNAGSVGYGFNVGARAQWQLSDRWAAFSDVIGGVQRFSQSFPSHADQGKLYTPWTFPKSARYGGGVRWRAADQTEISAGYRFLRMNTSLDRSDDAPDYEAHGLFVAVGRGIRK